MLGSSVAPSPGRRSLAARLRFALLVTAAAGAGCGAPAPGPDPATLSLLWISIDTLRADHLGTYGYARDTSPFIDSIAERGLVFDWAISPQNSTLPSHVTMFTGLHPVVHGVMHSTPRVGVTLRDFVPTLPETLRGAGFRTHAWVDGGKVAGSYGFARGFETYDDRKRAWPAKLARVVERLDEIGPGNRFFFFVHTYATHSPYEPPSPYDALFAEPGVDPARAMLDAYDGSIRYVDDGLRDFFTELELRGVLANTLVVITSDHGESFAEYGIEDVGHTGFNLHQNLTRVPWIVLHPDPRHRGRVREPVGLIDFPSTMLAQLGLDASALGLGTDVLDPAARRDREYLSWTGRVDGYGGPDREAWSHYADGYHLLHSEHPAGPERNALYRVERDPLETRPLDDAARRVDLMARLETHRAALLAERDAQPEPLAERRDLPSSLLSELVELGYVIESAEDIPEARAQLLERRREERGEADSRSDGSP